MSLYHIGQKRLALYTLEFIKLKVSPYNYVSNSSLSDYLHSQKYDKNRSSDIVLDYLKEIYNQDKRSRTVLRPINSEKLAEIDAKLLLQYYSKALDDYMELVRRNASIPQLIISRILFNCIKKKLINEKLLVDLFEIQKIHPILQTLSQICLAELNDKPDISTKLINKLMKEYKDIENIFMNVDILPQDFQYFKDIFIKRADIVFSKTIFQNIPKYNINKIPDLMKEYYTNVNNHEIALIEKKDRISFLIDQQIKNELNGFVNIPNVGYNKSSVNKELNDQYNFIINTWTTNFEQILEKDNTKEFSIHRVIPIKTAVKTVVNIFQYILMGNSYGIPITNVLSMVGNNLFIAYCNVWKKHYDIDQMVRKISIDYSYQSTMNPNIKSSSLNYLWNFISCKHGLFINNCQPVHWPNTIKFKVAGYMVTKFLESMKSSSEQYFESTLTWEEGKWIGSIRPNEFLFKLFSNYVRNISHFDFSTHEIPMLCPSVPWKSLHSGGFLVTSSQIIRGPLDLWVSREIEARSIDNRMSPVLDALSVLGNCSWKINNDILKIVIEYFKSGYTNEHLHIEGLTQLDNVSYPKIELKLTKSDNSSYKSDWPLAQKIIQKHLAESYALRVDLQYKLSVCMYLKDKTFWLPNNMDFRGRCYSISTHCSNVGSDLTRGLLLFSQGKPLGTNGLYWLKIHLANLTGKLKAATFEQRVKFIDKNLDEIRDSVINPFSGRLWWQRADDPWQALATSMELIKALEHKDPEKYVCHLPIHVDGSCNGLQHYAALGRDSNAAEKVNLSFEKRKVGDLYNEVALMVSKKCTEDSANGLAVAKKVNGLINRKIVKQTIMTYVYGVTQYGAKGQVRKQLQDLKGFDHEFLDDCSQYIVSLIMESLTTIFQNAVKVMQWFTGSSDILVNYNRFPSFITPLGFPVLQTYVANETTVRILHSLDGVNNSTRSILNDRIDRKGLANGYMGPILQPDKIANRNAFPPNYIHSLDACHMMMTALHCFSQGITFASVHDSFWTLPPNVDSLNKILRKQFVDLHSNNLLDELKFHFQEELNLSMQAIFNNEIISSIPPRGNFDIKEVISSPYFFS